MVDPSGTSTLTIRVSSILKNELDNAANRSNRSITDYVIKSIKESINGTCLSCGRDAAPSMPGGLTMSFQNWFNSLFPQDSFSKIAIVCILVQRQDGRRAYYGQVTKDFSLSSGFLSIRIPTVSAVNFDHQVNIPISEIIAWKEDNMNGNTFIGDTFKSLVDQGDLNGNDIIRRHLLGLAPLKPSVKK